MNEEEIMTKDAHGNILSQGDTVISTQNLMAGKMKIQKGTKVKNIRLTDDPEVIEGKIDGSMMVLKTCFFKKEFADRHSFFSRLTLICKITCCINYWNGWWF